LVIGASLDVGAWSLELHLICVHPCSSVVKFPGQSCLIFSEHRGWPGCPSVCKF
jgi:hypothetical protein